MAFLFEPEAPAFINDPYPEYRRLRDEAPLYFMEERGLWFLSRHADVEAAFSDYETFSSAKGNVISEAPVRVGNTLGSTDPPRHDELRRTVMRGFTPKRLEATISSLREHARELLAAHGDRREWDFVTDFSQPVLFAALARMLGFDAEAVDRASELSNGLFDGEDGVLGAPLPNERMAAIFEFLRGQLRSRKANPGEDLLSVLMAERQAGADLSDEYIVGNMSTVLLAGNASLGHFVPNLLLALYEWPHARREVLADADLWNVAVEEGVRYDTSTQAFARQTTREAQVSGGVIPADQRVVVLTGAANRDERAINDPDAFNLARGKVRHFGFGAGPHVCMGAQVARRFTRVLFEELTPALGEFELDLANARRATHLMARGFKSLPMRW